MAVLRVQDPFSCDIGGVLPGVPGWRAVSESDPVITPSRRVFFEPAKSIVRARPETWMFDTLNVRADGAVLGVEIAAPPMNLLGHRLVAEAIGAGSWSRHLTLSSAIAAWSPIALRRHRACAARLRRC